MGINDGDALAFEARPRDGEGAAHVAIQLHGPSGNPDAVGARVRLFPESGGPVQVAEVAAGGGYLSQSCPRLFFGLGGAEPGSIRIEVAWPDGGRTTHRLDELELRDGRRWIERSAP